MGDEKCIISLIEEIASKHPKGIEKLGVPTIDPFKAKNVVLGSDKGPVSLKVTMKNVELHGLAKLHMKTAKGFNKKFDNKSLKLVFSVEKIRIDSEMTVKGNVLALAINGDGKSEVTLDDVTLTVKAKVKSKEKDDKKYLNVKKVKVDMKAEK